MVSCFLEGFVFNIRNYMFKVVLELMNVTVDGPTFLSLLL